jgi:mRNA interferase RelE/StbE
LTYRVEILPAAQRELAAIPLRDRKRIDERIVSLSTTPRPPGAKALQGQKGQRGLLRLRVGDYRVVYQVQDEVLLVLVVKVGHRREIYRKR